MQQVQVSFESAKMSAVEAAVVEVPVQVVPVQEVPCVEGEAGDVPLFIKGEMVKVAQRTMPNFNFEGGAGKIMKVRVVLCLRARTPAVCIRG